MVDRRIMQRQNQVVDTKSHSIQFLQIGNPDVVWYNLTRKQWTRKMNQQST